MSSQKPVEVTGIWLRRIGIEAQVLAEIDGEWRLLIVETYDANFSHIIEPNGMRTKKRDTTLDERKRK